jgi:ribosome maturation factor RimP
MNHGLSTTDFVPYNPRPRWGGATWPASDPSEIEGPDGAFVFLDRRNFVASGVWGLWGPFLLEGRVDTALHDRLIALFEPVLKEIGYELVEVEFVPGQGGGTLRIYIDHPEGIDVDDCGEASHALSELLDANDPFPGAYSLEVSSPGLDRVLRTPQHFAQFVGERVKVELRVARDGRKRYTGMLRSTDGESIEMDVDNFSVSIKLAEIGRARLAPL